MLELYNDIYLNLSLVNNTLISGSMNSSGCPALS